jgi:hypothetical protein
VTDEPKLEPVAPDPPSCVACGWTLRPGSPTTRLDPAAATEPDEVYCSVCFDRRFGGQ